jgi:hypothetical protein
MFFALQATCLQVPERNPNSLHALLDFLLFRESEAETKMLLTASIDVERFSNDESHVLSSGFT